MKALESLLSLVGAGVVIFLAVALSRDTRRGNEHTRYDWHEGA
jgi:hypothetical protein